MTTFESPRIRELWELIHKHEPAAQFGGSLPGPNSGIHTYHRSWEDVPHDDGYSVHYYGDRSRTVLVGKTTYACALDVTLPSTVLMEKYTARLHRLAVANPRAYWSYGLREFAGTLNGTDVFAYDLTSRQRTFGWDSSHLWHIHLSFNRRFVLSRRILQIADVFKP